MPRSEGLTRLLTDVAAAFVLKNANVSKHEIHFVTPPKWTPLTRRPIDTLDDFGANKFVETSFGLGDVGIVCSSSTAPAIRAVYVYAHFKPDQPNGFRISPQQPTRRIVHDESPKGFGYESGKDEQGPFDYEGVWDFSAKKDSAEVVKLRVLNPGEVHYFLDSFSTGLYHKDIHNAHLTLWGNKPPKQTSAISDTEQRILRDQLEHLTHTMTLEIVLLLDNEDVLLFHWRHKQGRFVADIRNVGLKK